jgi:hypothetical protein
MIYYDLYVVLNFIQYFPQTAARLVTWEKGNTNSANITSTKAKYSKVKQKHLKERQT